MASTFVRIPIGSSASLTRIYVLPLSSIISVSRSTNQAGNLLQTWNYVKVKGSDDLVVSDEQYDALVQLLADCGELHDIG